jgi:protein-L-isoaspartate(D-aspartate) O-methyltransferase
VDQAESSHKTSGPEPWPGEDSLAERLAMVEDQLIARGLKDRRLLDAMAQIPREMFVPDDLRNEAYSDAALPIGYEQTISQPFTTAYMTEALGLIGTETVLEIGTGSGYAAAVLGCLAQRVYTVERIPPLAELAYKRLRRLGFENVEVRVANGTLGLPSAAPFDAIVVTAGGEQLPAPYREQLADGGRIVIPLGTRRDQILTRFTRRGDRWEEESLGHFLFVPLIGEHGQLRAGTWIEDRK